VINISESLMRILKAGFMYSPRNGRVKLGIETETLAEYIWKERAKGCLRRCVIFAR